MKVSHTCKKDILAFHQVVHVYLLQSALSSLNLSHGWECIASDVYPKMSQQVLSIVQVFCC